MTNIIPFWKSPLIFLMVLLMIRVSTTDVLAESVTFKTDVYIPDMQTQTDGDPVCLDSTGQLVANCEAAAAPDRTADLCKLYVLTGNRTPDYCPPSRIVFVTRATFTGSLGGVTGADAKCQAAASAASLAGTFLAWIASAPEDEPAKRFNTSDDIPFQLTSGALVANGWTDLTDSMLTSRINVTESRAILSNGESVWTNVHPDGTAIYYNDASKQCSSWSTDASGSGVTGNTEAINSGWTRLNALNCAQRAHLYCFQQ